MDPKEKRYVFDDPKNVKRLIWAVYAVCAVLFVLDFVLHRHVLNWWEGLYGFYGIFGFVSVRRARPRRQGNAQTRDAQGRILR